MGNFINTQHKEMIDAVTTGVTKELLKNPYYVFGNSKATPVIFYEIDNQNTTLDEASRLSYEPIGANSPIRYKKIDGLYLYGLERIELHYTSGESGLEADPVTGDCTDLPNTIHPCPGCYFEIPYLNKDDNHFLFSITDCTEDTLDDGNNIHKMSYELSRTSASMWNAIQKQVTNEYNFISNNINTGMNCIVQSKVFELVEKLDDISVLLKRYYNELFYNSRVQTYTCKYLDGYNFNDSYLIEFLIRNNILKNSGGEYIYITHQNPIGSTFAIDYAKTLFRSIETKDLNSVAIAITNATYWHIDNITTIFATRQEPYYSMQYVGNPVRFTGNTVQIFDDEFVRRLLSGELYEYGNTKSAYNIVIKMMHGIEEVTFDDINALENIQYENNLELYYMVPVIICSIEFYVKKLLLQHSSN